MARVASATVTTDLLVMSATSGKNEERLFDVCLLLQLERNLQTIRDNRTCLFAGMFLYSACADNGSECLEFVVDYRYA